MLTTPPATQTKTHAFLKATVREEIHKRATHSVAHSKAGHSGMSTMDLAHAVATHHAPAKTIQVNRYDHKHAIIDMHTTERVKSPLKSETESGLSEF